MTDGKCEHLDSKTVRLGNHAYEQCLGCGVRLEQVHLSYVQIAQLPQFDFRLHGDVLQGRLDTLKELKRRVLALYK